MYSALADGAAGVQEHLLGEHEAAHAVDADVAQGAPAHRHRCRRHALTYSRRLLFLRAPVCSSGPSLPGGRRGATRDYPQVEDLSAAVSHAQSPQRAVSAQHYPAHWYCRSEGLAKA
jgi:hypothetical protein